MDPSPDRTSSARFPSTHWSGVVAAGGCATPDGREALAELCRAYWYPLYAFIVARGSSRRTAQDLTQAYFARLLQTGVLAAADPEKGRFPRLPEDRLRLLSGRSEGPRERPQARRRRHARLVRRP